MFIAYYAINLLLSSIMLFRCLLRLDLLHVCSVCGNTGEVETLLIAPTSKKAQNIDTVWKVFLQQSLVHCTQKKKCHFLMSWLIEHCRLTGCCNKESSKLKFTNRKHSSHHETAALSIFKGPGVQGDAGLCVCPDYASFKIKRVWLVSIRNQKACPHIYRWSSCVHKKQCRTS